MDTNKFNEAMIAASIRAKDTGEKCYVFRIPPDDERRPSHRERRPMDLNLCDQLIEEGKSPQEISIALRGDKSLSGAVQQRIMSKKMREMNND